jgi:hypothetical protein
VAAATELEEDEFGEGAAAAAAAVGEAALCERLVLLRPFFFLSVDDLAFFFLPPLPPPPLAVMREEKYELTDSSTAGVAAALVVVAALGEEDDCSDDDDVEAASALAELGLPLPLMLVIASPLPLSLLLPLPAVSSPPSLGDDDEEGPPILPKIFLREDLDPTENLCRPRPVTAARRSARDFRELAAMAASGDVPGVLGPSLLLGWAGVVVHVVVDTCASCTGDDDSEDTALPRAAGGDFAVPASLGWPGGEVAPWGLFNAPVAVHVPVPMGDLPSMTAGSSIFGTVDELSSLDSAAGAAAAAAGLRLLIWKTISPSSEESSS